MIAVQKKEKPIILFDSTTLGKFNIEVQSVDRYNLNNLYLKTPRARGRVAPISDLERQKRLAMHKKRKGRTLSP